MVLGMVSVQAGGLAYCGGHTLLSLPHMYLSCIKLRSLLSTSRCHTTKKVVIDAAETQRVLRQLIYPVGLLAESRGFHAEACVPFMTL